MNGTRLIPLRPQNNWHTPPVSGWLMSAAHCVLSLPYDLGGCDQWTRCFVQMTDSHHSQPPPYCGTRCQQALHDHRTSSYSPHYSRTVVCRTSLVMAIVPSPLAPPTHASPEMFNNTALVTATLWRAIVVRLLIGCCLIRMDDVCPVHHSHLFTHHTLDDTWKRSLGHHQP